MRGAGASSNPRLSGDCRHHRLPPIAERPGTQIGPYKLLQEIGEGGMGIVYMAQQREPVRRKVALKIIKPGMDTREVIGPVRGRAAGPGHDGSPEHRQGVTMRAPPNPGRPYFVMELVNGVPITEYCDDNNLTDPRTTGAVYAGLPRRPARPPERASSTATSNRRTSW